MSQNKSSKRHGRTASVSSYERGRFRIFFCKIRGNCGNPKNRFYSKISLFNPAFQNLGISGLKTNFRGTAQRNLPQPDYYEKLRSGKQLLIILNIQFSYKRVRARPRVRIMRTRALKRAHTIHQEE